MKESALEDCEEKVYHVHNPLYQIRVYRSESEKKQKQRCITSNG